MSKSDDKYKKMLEHQARAFNAYLEKVGAFEVDDLQAKLRGTRAELGLMKGKADKLEDELNKTKKALRDTANGKPSEWAYVQLKNDADKLAEVLEQIQYDLGRYEWPVIQKNVNQALKEYRGEK